MAGAESYAKDRSNNLEIQTSPRKIVKFHTLGENLYELAGVLSRRNSSTTFLGKKYHNNIQL